MPSIADFTVLSDGVVTLPRPGSSDHHIRFATPAVDTAQRAIVMFRVNPRGDLTLRFRINNEASEFLFDTDPQRSWHEVINAGVLEPGGNELTISRTSGSGSADVSDIVVLYQAVVPS